MPNLYERVVEYDNEADRASNTNPRILESTYDTSIGQDTDNEIIRSKNEGDNKVRQILDYDILRTPNTSSIVTPGTWDEEIPQMYESDTSGRSIVAEDASFNRNWDKGVQIDHINNGRLHDINIINKEITLGEDKDIVFVNNNQDNSIKGLIEYNVLNDIFFSDMNKKVIQDSLRYGVYKKTNQIVSPQSDNELFIIMRSII